MNKFQIILKLLLENKEEDSGRNSEDNFSPETFKGCVLNSNLFKNP